MDIRVITVIKDITDIMVMVDIRNYAESIQAASEVRAFSESKKPRSKTAQ